MFVFDIEQIKNELEGMSFQETLDVLEKLDDDLELAIAGVYQLNNELIKENHVQTEYELEELAEKISNSEKPQHDERDPLFIDAARCFVIAKKARMSALQRLFDIRYKRADLIMDQLETVGIIGPVNRICEGSCIDNATPRKVLVDETSLEQILREQ